MKEKEKRGLNERVANLCEEKDKFFALTEGRQGEVLELTQSKCRLEQELAEVRLQVLLFASFETYVSRFEKRREPFFCFFK